MDQSTHMPALVIFVSLTAIGLLLVLAWLLLGRTRGYLLYLGIAFLGAAVSQFAAGVGAVVVLLLTLAAFVMALLEAAQDMRARAETLRAEAQERETAFAEMTTELMRVENPARETPEETPATGQ